CPWGCGELVLMSTTEHGNPMPLQPKPDPTGNQAAYKDGLGRWRSRSLTGRDARRPEHLEETFRPHVADCPNRAEQQTHPGTPSGGRTRLRRTRPRRSTLWRSR
ncbi:hypothetical protein, partial [Nonomuraea antimicrobica]|uniref:hypothetical protein n=1 Tax=Nonomuraea antimicrobica TaxID=561173 RepID=UPI0031EFA301